MFFRCFPLLFILMAGQVLFAQQRVKADPRPTSDQLAAQDMEFYLFTHFGPNTFTDLEWGHGTEKASSFAPTALNCRQWARIARQCGAKGIIITAKHHDGFCLWPSRYSTHTVRESGWKNGRGDVLRELSAACAKEGIKFGVYLSPWDRNHPDYGTPQYNDVYVKMLKEVLTQYGPVWELWWDGANGEGPNGKKQVYDWPRFKTTVQRLSPHTVVFSDIGPHLRWVGNEQGFVGKTNWNLLDTTGFTPGQGAPHPDTLQHGNMNGQAWISAECDVSIRPGWFYHANEDSKVKSPEALFDLYLKSVGRGGNFLLNVPPDHRGLFAAPDSASLAGFGQLMRENFKHNLSAKTQKLPTGTYRVDFQKPEQINCIVLAEYLKHGQRVISGEVEIWNGNKRVQSLPFTTIGHKRILTFSSITADHLIVRIDQSKKQPRLKPVSVFQIAERLIEKE